MMGFMITHGARLLRDWMNEQDVNQESVAVLLTEKRGTRVYQSSVSAWLRGAQIPLWAALALEQVTNVPASSWTESADSGVDVNAAAARAS